MTVLFYEKPGCINNTKQKRILDGLGLEVVAKDLRDVPWTADRLRPFFTGLPVADWFNKAATRVKSGEVVPADFTEGEALVAMVADPLLIRRPLVETQKGRFAGWEPGSARMRAAGLEVPDPNKDLESCPRGVCEKEAV